MKDEKARVLVVDDEPQVRQLLSRWLRADEYLCAAASSGEEATELLESSEFDLVVCDITMPGISGVDLLALIKYLYPDTAVLMATAIDDRETATRTMELGAYGYLIKPFSRNDVLISVANALERRRLTLLSQEYEKELESKVRERTLEVREQSRQIREREEEIVFRLLSSMGWRDDETGAHARRIGLYSAAMAEVLGWDAEATDNIRLAAPMHDLGKIGIPDAILRKPGKLTAEEFESIKKHTVIGAGILEGSTVPLLQLARDIALSHHEKWDGAGYPHGLAGEDIPECGRIVAVADVYDALVHKRVYKPAFSEDKALSIMKEENGRHFDPKVLQAFLDSLPATRRIREEVPDEEESGVEFSRAIP